MFWLFAILVLINGTVDNEKVILYYRFDVAGLPINMLDIGLGLMFIVALVTLNKPKFQVDRTHPALNWSIGVLIGSLFFGVLGAIKSDVELKFWAVVARNVITLPLCIFLGYHVIRHPRQASWATYIMVVASIGSALFVLVFVRETGETLGAMSSFDRLRSTSYGGDLGLSAMTMIAFALVAGIHFLPTWLSLLLIPLTAIGFFSMPHRSNWVAGALTMTFATFFLPRVKLGRRIWLTSALGAGLVLSMVIGVATYSRLTGRDFGEYITRRLQSLLPGEQMGVQSKAWESRLPGARRELEIWLKNPVMGQGFGIQMEEEVSGKSSFAGGFRHNVWTASLAESGLFGLLGYLVAPITAMVIGFRLVRQSQDKSLIYMGALGAVVGFAALVYSPMTLSINVQRVAIPLGLVCGMVYKCRAIQLTLAREQQYWQYQDELPLAEAEMAYGMEANDYT